MQPLAQLWASLIEILEQTLFFFNSYVHNYGLAIILLTILIRVLLLPVTLKQTASMQQLQKIQPHLKKLQQKYKGDKEKLSQEMMKLYSKYKVNPLGGCLPLLIQLPIFFALFRMLYRSRELAQAGFLWISNLSRPDPYFILVILVIASQYYSQKMMSTSDPQQQRMMNIMLVVLAFFAWQLPSGVLIYWVTTNVLAIVQQYVTVQFAPDQSKA